VTESVATQVVDGHTSWLVVHRRRGPRNSETDRPRSGLRHEVGEL